MSCRAFFCSQKQNANNRDCFAAVWLSERYTHTAKSESRVCRRVRAREIQPVLSWRDEQESVERTAVAGSALAILFLVK